MKFKGRLENSDLCFDARQLIMIPKQYYLKKCSVKLFADDTSLFTVVRDPNAAANDMNHDLELISQWTHDWKMSFNPDPQKQAVELLLSKKRNGIDHPGFGTKDLYTNFNVMEYLVIFLFC